MLSNKEVKEREILKNEFFYGLDYSDATFLLTEPLFMPSQEPSHEEWHKEDHGLNPYE